MPASAPVVRNLHPAVIEHPLLLPSRIVRKLFSLWITWTYPFAGVGEKLSIDSDCEIHRWAARRIKLGSSVSLHRGVWLNIASTSDETDVPAIIIGDRCNIGRGSMISAKNRIHFEADVMFGPAAVVMDHSHAYEDVTRPVSKQGVTEGGRIRIEQGAWIGHGAAIVCVSGELVLGRNCVVAANSVVTKSVPPFSVVSGNPARVVKQFDSTRQMWVLGAVRSQEPCTQLLSNQTRMEIS